MIVQVKRYIHICMYNVYIYLIYTLQFGDFSSEISTFYRNDSTTVEDPSNPARRPTTRALLYVVGSLCMVSFRESRNVSFWNGPPTSAPTAKFGFGTVEFSHLKPSVQPVLALAGIEAPL